MSYHYQLRHQSLLVRPWPTSPQRGAVGAEGWVAVRQPQSISRRVLLAAPPTTSGAPSSSATTTSCASHLMMPLSPPPATPASTPVLAAQSSPLVWLRTNATLRPRAQVLLGYNTLPDEANQQPAAKATYRSLAIKLNALMSTNVFQIEI